MSNKKFVNTTLSILAMSAAAVSAQSHAGTVNVTVDANNQVTITGSPTRDRLVLRGFSSGSTVLIARSGTDINFEGSTSSRLTLPSAIGITVDARGGNDLLVIRNADAEDMEIDLGTGNDRLVLRGNNQLDGGFADGGPGRDTVTGDLAGLELRAGSFEVDNSTGGAPPPPPVDPTPPPADPTPPVSNPNNLPVIQVGTSGTFPTAVTTELVLGAQLFVMTQVPTGSIITLQDFNSASGLRFLGDSLEQDILDVSAIDADTTQPGNQAFRIVSLFTGQPGELQLPTVDFNTADGGLVGSLRFDRDGDGVTDFRISLRNNVFQESAAGPWGDNIIP